MTEYIRYYHEDRTHFALRKEIPAERKAHERLDGGRMRGQRRIDHQECGGLR
jgi:hypothetical protein